MLTTLKLHPALFSRAWLNLMPFAKLADEYENALLLEEHVNGVWLVALPEIGFAACWLPFDPGYERVPSFNAEPINPPVLIGDGDGRIADRCKFEWKRWKKSSADAGDDEYVVIGPTASPDRQKQALPGLERVNVRVRTLDWHQDTIEVQKPCPDWRGHFRTFGHGSRTAITLSLEAMKALTAIEGCTDPRVEFGDGTHALLTFEPADGIRPVTFVHLAVGKREDTAVQSVQFDTLVQQNYDTATGQWRDEDDAEDVVSPLLSDPDGADDPEDDPEDDEQDIDDDPSVRLAQNAARTALASLLD